MGSLNVELVHPSLFGVSEQRLDSSPNTPHCVGLCLLQNLLLQGPVQKVTLPTSKGRSFGLDSATAHCEGPESKHWSQEERLFGLDPSCRPCLSKSPCPSPMHMTFYKTPALQLSLLERFCAASSAMYQCMEDPLAASLWGRMT